MGNASPSDKSSMRSYVLTAVLLALLASCGGGVGPAGPTGPQGGGGAQGAQGNNGNVGPQGPTGPAGPNTSKISSNIVCLSSSFTVEGWLVFVQFETTAFVGGDSYVSCSATTNAGEYTQAEFYSTTSANPTCIVTASVGGDGGGFWTFSSTSGTRKAVYAGGSSYTYTFTAGQCNSL